MIASHLPLVRSIARRHVGRGEELEDLVQVGAVGLVKASGRFDESRGATFAAFAAPTIEGEILNHLRDRAQPVRIPREQERLRSELRQQREELSSTLGRSPTARELAAAVDAEEGDVERALAAERARTTVSISSEAEPAAPEAGSDVLTSDDRLLLAERMRCLDEREQRIVLLRFHGDMTVRQIAREVGLSQAHVSRLLSGALTKLREDLVASESNASGGDTTADTPRTKISAVAEPEEQEVAVSGEEERPGHKYSGRFLVRMPKSLHEQLARRAEQEQISLNRLVINVLDAATQGEPSESATGDETTGDETTGNDAAGNDGVANDGAGRRARPARMSARQFHLALVTNLVVLVLVAAVAIMLLVLALERGI